MCVEVRGRPRGPVLSHCSPFNGRGSEGGWELEQSEGEESKKGKGDGKRKDTEKGGRRK